jgi:hypothetical protein
MAAPQIEGPALFVSKLCLDFPEGQTSQRVAHLGQGVSQEHPAKWRRPSPQRPLAGVAGCPRFVSGQAGSVRALLPDCPPER